MEEMDLPPPSLPRPMTRIQKQYHLIKELWPADTGVWLEVLDFNGSPATAMGYLPKEIHYTCTRTTNRRARVPPLAHLIHVDFLSSNSYPNPNDIVIVTNVDKYIDKGGVAKRMAWALRGDGVAFATWDSNRDPGQVEPSLNIYFGEVVVVKDKRTPVCVAICEKPKCLR